MHGRRVFSLFQKNLSQSVERKKNLVLMGYFPARSPLHRIVFYTERHKPLRIHTQRFVWLALYGCFKLNDQKDEYAIYYDAVYKYKSPPTAGR
jgi:hypothetical protein